MNKIFISLLLLSNLLFSKDIPLGSKMIELKLEKNQLTLFTFPFYLKMDNIKILGIKSAFSGNTNENSLYFTLTQFPMNLIVFGDSNPIYLSLKESTKEDSKKYTKPDSVYNFYKKEKPFHESFELSSLDSDLVGIYDEINEEGELVLENYYKKNINQVLYFDDLKSIKITIKNSFENEKYLIKELIIANTTNGFIDLYKEFSLIDSMSPFKYLLSYSFNEEHLAPFHKTIGYFIYDKTKEL